MKAMEEQKSVLRWGGLTGILGAIFLILAFVTRGAFVGLDPADPEGPVAASIFLVDPPSPIVVVSFLALIVFHLVLGWKVYNLSRAP